MGYSVLMVQCDVEEAASQLSELADKAADGERIIFTKGNKVFEIVQVPKVPDGKPVRQAGTGGKGWISPDFDEPLEEMSEYM